MAPNRDARAAASARTPRWPPPRPRLQTTTGASPSRDYHAAHCSPLHRLPMTSPRLALCRSPRVQGFTLIELMVVLVIIGVLAAFIVPNVLDRADDARVTAARSDVNNLMQALKLYRLDNQRYPTAEQGLSALVRKPTAGP